MKKLSIMMGLAILAGGFALAEPLYQASPAQTKTEKKSVTPAEKTPKKTETKKDVKKVPVRKTVAKPKSAANNPPPSNNAK